MPDSSMLERLRGQLVVSCQANPDSPLRDPSIISRLALAAELGGAAGLRLQGFEDVRAVRAVTDLPIIGLTKTDREDTEVYITPTAAEAVRLAELGAEIVALDATLRPRPEPLADMFAAVHAVGALVMADISTLEEARAALDLGADIVSTTLSGYTPYSRQLSGPDWALMDELREAGLPFVAEGRLNTPADAARALKRGAQFVVVGSAITRPDVVTRWFVQALQD
ncbi:N-acetylmannosamine-6-phosphate 2-epimerase (plasmid) [Deinococcus metallilatus]|uniref:Putative N-acetylmannosamine-6-phosphate 2-epimerase n=1 Tax=Deinococcus metallilatus TaxID=1211322 RepID=A0ABR6N162_9DEIO|nr:N-acetylmannosamine-6-phosphate 2-epimerase [Deinococcus metallilatus]MBB5296952.1 N-acylglucosamine-6-phosphate 2-epimerase [Deinococcus metallilatus]QBY06680.1 N-acetylmannosamine-6-phosphate 2-epimerase [Deinococcus metallilatus]GMA15149.1 putative N-acetylmannosamine-6-phosphate 2-epimerase [Deinococcus metallilatus]